MDATRAAVAEPPIGQVLRTTDIVFERLYRRISTLDLMPGDRISEAEIAAEFGVSRQPVRDAFNRLVNLDLLLIRPQKATVVRKFSRASISSARFVRLAVELEIVRKAARNWDGSMSGTFQDALAAQRNAVSDMDRERFHELDYEFHRLLCIAAGQEAVFDVIQSNKAKVDRMCMLSLAKGREASHLLDDHASVFKALSEQDTAALEAAMRVHLGRLDETVDSIFQSHREYFED